jgi:hypothetical protein
LEPADRAVPDMSTVSNTVAPSLGQHQGRYILRNVVILRPFNNHNPMAQEPEGSSPH